MDDERRTSRFWRHPSTWLSLIAVCLLAAGTAVAGSLIDSGDVKNSSLTGKDVKNKSLTKADFKGSVKGARGPQGAAGSRGATGPTGQQGTQGPAGPTASGFGTANPEPDTTDIGLTPVDLVSTTVTTTPASSRIVATATITVGASGDDIECFIRIDGANVGLSTKERVADAFDVVTMTGAGTVGAGAHPVALRCARTTGGTVAFTQGQITAVAAGL